MGTMKGGIALFDYDALDGATSTEVRQRTGEIRALMRRTAEDIIAIGPKLAEVKERRSLFTVGKPPRGYAAWKDRLRSSVACKG